MIRPQPNQDKAPPNGRLTLDPECIELCPRCGDVMHRPFVALSRIYSKTYICSDCGGAEAVDGKKSRWIPVVFEWNLKREALELAQQEADEREHWLREEVERLEIELRRNKNALKTLRDENQKFNERNQKNLGALEGFKEEVAHLNKQLRDLLRQTLHQEDK